MTPLIQPALTPDEWATALANRALFGDPAPAQRHMRAALDLHGQPFGFTHEDVLYLRAAMSYYARRTGATENDHPSILVILRSLVTRIEALLPPNP